MIKIGLLVLSVALTGCASKPAPKHQGQYCYTDQTIVKRGGSVVDSQTVLQCTDRPGQQTAIQRAGIDSKCEEFWYSESRWGKMVPVRGVRCEKLNGTWEIINVDSPRR